MLKILIAAACVVIIAAGIYYLAGQAMRPGEPEIVVVIDGSDAGIDAAAMQQFAKVAARKYPKSVRIEVRALQFIPSPGINIRNEKIPDAIRGELKPGAFGFVKFGYSFGDDDIIENPL